MEKPLIHKKYLLEKFPGKGGWTFAQIPEIAQNKNNPFGWVKVRGSIDGVAIENYHLMPMGNGKLFLPVKAAIRKKIGKQAGDYVDVILYNHPIPQTLTKELEICLQDEPLAYNAFLANTEAEQKKLIAWVYASKTEEQKVERIAQMIEQLLKGK